MNKIIALLTLVAAFTLPIASWAADSSNGCGLGWSVTQAQTLFGTSTRGTTNTFLPNTFSMTSGTSNCAKHPIAQKDVPAFEYVAVNHDALTVEMAQGSGENIAALARTMGCADASVEQFGRMTQSHYSAIVGAGGLAPDELFENVKNQLQGDPVLSIACHS